jgi:hypothetical protein
VTEAGRFDRFFYIPCWVECVTLMQTAQLQRQSTVLTPVDSFLCARLQFLAPIRFDSSIEASAERSFLMCYDETSVIDPTPLQILMK